MTTATWATTGDVTDITGATVDDAAVRRAEATIELHAGTIARLTVDVVGARDRYWLQQAVAYQAGWEAEQAGLYSRSDVSSVGQDGQQVQFKPDGQVLAPLAKRALKRLSWKGTRTTNPGTLTRNLGARMPDDVDDSHDWRPL